MKKTRWWLVLLVAGGLSTGSFEIQESEYKCESALAHMADCCPGFEPSNYACYQEGCGDVVPDLQIADSDCIRSKSCHELKEEGFCDVPRLGSPPSNNTACEAARELLGVCCGTSYRDHWQCYATSMCGVPPPGKPRLSEAAIDCQYAGIGIGNQCDNLKARGFCDDLEAPRCDK